MPQIMRILQNIRPDRQTVMFSATFPKSVEILARKVMQMLQTSYNVLSAFGLKHTSASDNHFIAALRR